MPNVTPLLRFDVANLQAEVTMWENEMRSLITEGAAHGAIEEASEALARAQGALQRAEKNLKVADANIRRGVRAVSVEISGLTHKRLLGCSTSLDGLREHRDLRNWSSFTYRGLEVKVSDFHAEHGIRGAHWYRGILGGAHSAEVR